MWTIKTVGANTETRRRKIPNSSEFKIKTNSKFKLPLTAVNLKYQKGIYFLQYTVWKSEEILNDVCFEVCWDMRLPGNVVDVTTIDSVYQKMFSDVWQVLMKQ